ncbi:MAG: hypothetical protein R3Y11_04605 [Pseudomonadota bacterium]
MRQKSKRAQKSKDNKTEEIRLDAILNSKSPVIRQVFVDFLSDEMDQAQERALIRSGVRFRHLLSPRQQELVLQRAKELSLAIV